MRLSVPTAMSYATCLPSGDQRMAPRDPGFSSSHRTEASPSPGVTMAGRTAEETSYGSLVGERIAAKRFPSGDQSNATTFMLGDVTARGAPPASSIVYRRAGCHSRSHRATPALAHFDCFSPSGRAGVAVNATRRPSGEKANEVGSAAPVSSARASPPPSDRRWMRAFPSFFRRNPSVVPSGDQTGADDGSVAKVSWRGSPPSAGAVQIWVVTFHPAFSSASPALAGSKSAGALADGSKVFCRSDHATREPSGERATPPRSESDTTSSAVGRTSPDVETGGAATAGENARSRATAATARRVMPPPSKRGAARSHRVIAEVLARFGDRRCHHDDGRKRHVPEDGVRAARWPSRGAGALRPSPGGRRALGPPR